MRVLYAFIHITRCYMKFLSTPKTKKFLITNLLINIMKNSKQCPKCSSKKIIRIPGKFESWGAGNNIRMGIFVKNAVLVTRYLCNNCGFSEEWIDKKEDIEKLKKKY